MRRAIARWRWLVGLGTMLSVVGCSGASNGFDLSDTSIPRQQIHAGGPPRDGIPAIDRPRFVSGDESEPPGAEDRVLGVSLAGIARAYPIAIMNWHEIVNDRLGDRPVVVSYCPLCGSGVAFSAEVGGTALHFGVSGLLYNSDILLYDRETESLWSQLLSRAVSGPMKGRRLTPLPLEHTTWADWRQRHPTTQVLSRDTGYRRDYNRDPYAGYETDDGLYFPVADRDPRYHPKEQVLGVEVKGHFKAYPFAELSRVSGEVRDRIADHEVTIRYDPEHRSAMAYDAAGRPLPAVRSYWFAWYAFHPDTAVFEAASRSGNRKK